MAEGVGDKLLFTTGVLATRYRAGFLLCGISVAFLIKMGVAAMAGGLIAALPPAALATVNVLTFVSLAAAIWWKKPEAEETPAPAAQGGFKAIAVPFAAVLFAEWGDIGQITTVALSARFHTPALVWCGATLAMLTKAALAMTFGAGLRRYLPQPVLRYCSVPALVLIAVLAAFRVAD